MIALLADLLKPAAIDVHDPDILRPVTIRDKGNPVAVRAVTRLEIPGEIAGQGAGFAARDRYGVKVAEHVKDQSLPIRMNIDIRPAQFSGINADRVPVTRWAVDRPGTSGAVLAVFSFLGFLGQQRNGRQQSGQNDQKKR